MNKHIEKELLHSTQYLVKEFKLNKSDTERLKNILILMAKACFGKDFDSNKNHKDIFEPAAWPMPNIESYFQDIPSNKVFEIFENNSIDDLIEFDFFFTYNPDFDFDFLLTHEELNNIINQFIQYLLNNRYFIIETGFPLTSFELNPWFYNNLARLYPLKIPCTILRKEKDKAGNYLLEYHWNKNPENLFDSSNLKKHDFKNAPYGNRYSFDTIDLIENKRATLFDLKIEILKILAKALHKKSCVGIWDNCLNRINGKLKLEEFNSLIEISEKYWIYTDSYPKNTDDTLAKKYNISRSDNRFNEGGVKYIIEIIFQVEKELRLGHMNKIKNKLLILSKNKKISSYYNLLLNINISDLCTIGEEIRKYKEEKNQYKKFFEQRLTQSLEESYKNQYSDKVTKSDLIRLSNSIIYQINKKTDFNEVKKHFYTSKNDIKPIELPPNTKWNNVVIQFLDNERVVIKAPDNFEKIRTFQEMGFVNMKKKERPPDRLWDFLHYLAKHNGTLSWDDYNCKSKNTKEEKKLIDNAKKNKQHLIEKLKYYFQIDEDPIPFKRKEKIYQTRFMILSQEHLRD